MKPITPLALCASFLAMACTTGDDPQVGVMRGAQVFSENCAICHGSNARGASNLPTATGDAPDLTLLSQRNSGTFPEIETLATIYGPAYHQGRGTIMPEFGAGDLGPLVVVEVEEGIGTPIPADLLALSAYLRTLQR